MLGKKDDEIMRVEIHISEPKHRPPEPLKDPDSTAYFKITWRIVPFLFICYVFNYPDRINAGFTKLQMLSDLKLTETAYGVGAGTFLIG